MIETMTQAMTPVASQVTIRQKERHHKNRHHKKRKLRIATRQSRLALWQANDVKRRIESTHQGVGCEIVGMTTEGDRNKHSPLPELGGKGVFVKELEQALLDGSADIAVHSMKDVPGNLPDGLTICAICERADPRDALVCSASLADTNRVLQDFSPGAVIGSSSLRRRLQLGRSFPQLAFEDSRGNVETRLRKLDDGQYHAVVLAVAGLERLQLGHRITQKIPIAVCLPAAGQGAVGIESRLDDDEINPLMQAINHDETWCCVSSERRVTASLGATCTLPVAAYAQIESGAITIAAFVADIRGTRVITESVSGDLREASALSGQLGQRLLDQGAAELIADPAYSR